MKKISLILILLMVLTSTTLVVSAETCEPVDPILLDLLNSYSDGCYHVNASGNYQVINQNIAQCLFAAGIPTSLDFVANSTVHKDGYTITVNSFTFNPIIPTPAVASTPVTIDITDLKFINNLDVLINGGTIGFTATIKKGAYGIPVAGVAKYERIEGGVIVFSFNNLTIGTIDITTEDVTGEMRVSIVKFPCETNPIPEFPTIVIPVAAIIGLAFFMQRRKE